MTYAINNVSIPGKAEAFMIVLDLNGVGMTQFPMSILKQFLKTVQNNYRGRGYKTLVLNANMLMRASWAVVRQMLDEFTA